LQIARNQQKEKLVDQGLRGSTLGKVGVQ